MAGAVTRSRLADGRVVGWYGDAAYVIDAEIAAQPVPRALARRYGAGDFWRRWTAAECAAKAYDVPIALWLREHGLDAGALEVTTVHWEGLVVSLGHTIHPKGGPASAANVTFASCSQRD